MAALQEIGVGLIGCGGMGREHARNLRTLPGVHLVAIGDPSEAARRRLVTEFDVPHSYADYRQVLERHDVDAVIVTVPNALHRTVALDTIAAGKHMLLEKPLAHSLEDGAKIVAAAERSDRVVMLGFNNRFNPASRALSRAIQADRLGSIYYARARWLRRDGMPPQGSWFSRKDTSGGGPLIDIGVHMLDLALYMLGYPRAVQALGITHAHFGPERARSAPVGIADLYDVEDFAAGLITLEGGRALQIEASWASYIGEGDEMYLDLLGTKGGARWTTAGETELALYTTLDGEQVNIVPQLAEGRGHQEELRAFRDAIIAGGPTPVPLREGLHVLAIIDALYASARSGMAAPVGDLLSSGGAG